MRIIITTLFLITFVLQGQTGNSDKPTETKHDFTITQYYANDINFRGLSIYGEKLSRRNQESYKSFAESWFLSTNVIFHLPLPGLKFLLTSNNPLENRSNKDADLRFQTTPGGDEQVSKFNRAIQSGVFDYDPNALILRMQRKQ